MAPFWTMCPMCVGAKRRLAGRLEQSVLRPVVLLRIPEWKVTTIVTIYGQATRPPVGSGGPTPPPHMCRARVSRKGVRPLFSYPDFASVAGHIVHVCAVGRLRVCPKKRTLLSRSLRPSWAWRADPTKKFAFDVPSLDRSADPTPSTPEASRDVPK